MPDKRVRRADLSEGDFKRENLSAEERSHLMSAFGGKGLIDEVLEAVNDGKEATVYLCAAGETARQISPDAPPEFLAAKVYRARKFRAFAREDQYMGGPVRGIAPRDTRGARAIRQRTDLGLALANQAWIAREWEALGALHAAGADVPRPYDHSESAILMEFACDESAAAPRLVDAVIPEGAAQGILDRLLANVELLLRNDLVHGDLSAYNVLYAAGRIWLIDLPQAVDARSTPHAAEMLRRDLHNVCSHLTRKGATVSGGADAFATELWRRYVYGEL